MYKKLLFAGAFVTFTALLCMDPLTKRARASSDEDQVTLQSGDGQEFKIEVGRARLSQTLSNLIEDSGVDAPLPVPNISGAILEKIVTLLPFIEKINSGLMDDAVNAKKVVAEVISSYDIETLTQFIKAVNFLDIPVLLSQAIEVAGQKDVKEFTFAQIMDIPKDIRNQILYPIFLNKLGPISLKQLTHIPIGKSDYGDEEQVSAVCVTPDGTKLIGVPNHDVAAWDMATKKLLAVYKQISAPYEILVTPDSTKLITHTGAEEGWEIVVWDLLTGRWLRDLDLSGINEHGKGVRDFAMSPKGTILAAPFDDNFVYLFNIHTGKRVGRLKNPGRTVTFSPDGNFVVIGDTEGNIRVQNMYIKNAPLVITSNSGEIKSLNVTPDTKQIVSVGTDNTLRIWDIKTGAELASYVFKHDEINDVKISIDGTMIIISSNDGDLQVIDFKTGKKIGLCKGHTMLPSSFCLTPDGKQIVSSSGYNTALPVRDVSIRTWDLTLFNRLKLLSNEQAVKVWEYVTKNAHPSWEGIYELIAPELMTYMVPIAFPEKVFDADSEE